MSKTLFVQEDKQWVGHPPENAQYQRIARAWNAIHLYLIQHPDLLCTSVIQHGSAFFRYKGELLMAEQFRAEPLGADSYLSLNDFEGQGEMDLSDLADGMESWLSSPSGIKRTPAHGAFVELLLDKPDDLRRMKYLPEYLTAEIPPSISDSFCDRGEEITTPDHLDFRA